MVTTQVPSAAKLCLTDAFFLFIDPRNFQSSHYSTGLLFSNEHESKVCLCHHRWSVDVGRRPNVEVLSLKELIELRSELDTLIVQKQADERAALKAQLVELAKENGFELDEIVGKRRADKRGAVAIKYRDPDNPENTWTGRGRMPRWMTAATKKRGVKKEDFLL